MYINKNNYMYQNSNNLSAFLGITEKQLPYIILGITGVGLLLKYVVFRKKSEVKK